MSETRTEGKKGRRASRTPSETAAKSEGGSFQIVASGENVVMINSSTGQTWAMTHDGTRAVWHPVAFEGGAPKAPRRQKTGEDAAST